MKALKKNNTRGSYMRKYSTQTSFTKLSFRCLVYLYLNWIKSYNIKLFKNNFFFMPENASFQGTVLKMRSGIWLYFCVNSTTFYSLTYKVAKKNYLIFEIRSNLNLLIDRNVQQNSNIKSSHNFFATICDFFCSWHFDLI